jgi:putative phage-type endonuclease
MENNEQKTKGWFEDRRGKFTASEFHKLMTSGKSKDQLFGATALDYIDEKVDEIITSGDLNDFGGFAGNKATEWGEYWEPIAREKFTEKTGIEVLEVGFLQIEERWGGSPDGVTEDSIIEIKCPYASKNHTANLFIETQEDLKKEHKEYYIQMQVNMLAAKKKKGYFISFDPRKLHPTLSLKVIEISIDETLVAEMKMRYNEAMKILSSRLEILYNQL